MKGSGHPASDARSLLRSAKPGPSRTQTRERRGAKPSDDLHVCPACEGGLVYPTGWEEAGLTHWQVDLRCPNCEWAGTGIFSQVAVDRLDIELERGTDAVVDDLRRLMRANMEEEVERFARALQGDHVLPCDF